MQHRDSLFEWAIPCGTWMGVRLRLSPLFLIVVAVLCLPPRDLQVGAAFGGCLLAAVLCHELAHAFAIHLTGGKAKELLLWPLGGVARLSASSAATPVATAFAGPMTNLLACLVCLPALLRSGAGWPLLNPLALPHTDFAAEPGHSLLTLFFFANWLLVVANLLPAAPLAAGRLLDTALIARLGPSLGQPMLFRVGMAIGFGLIIAGLLLDGVWLAAIGAGLLAYNLREAMRHQISENFDESFMGYDFSQGYTSLERSMPVETEVRQSLVQRWRARRKVMREERQRQRAEEEEKELDILLAKVHTYGINSLTDSERRTLKRASARYRGKPKD